MHGIGTWPQWEGTNESRYAQLVRGTRRDGAVDAVYGIPNGTTWYTVIREPAPCNDGSGKAHGWDLYLMLDNALPEVVYTTFFLSKLCERTQSFFLCRELPREPCLPYILGLSYFMFHCQASQETPRRRGLM